VNEVEKKVEKEEEKATLSATVVAVFEEPAAVLSYSVQNIMTINSRMVITIIKLIRLKNRRRRVIRSIIKRVISRAIRRVIKILVRSIIGRVIRARQWIVWGAITMGTCTLYVGTNGW
jgi:predicted thioredoxin/glutaredoxin